MKIHGKIMILCCAMPAVLLVLHQWVYICSKWKSRPILYAKLQRIHLENTNTINL